MTLRNWLREKKALRGKINRQIETGSWKWMWKKLKWWESQSKIKKRLESVEYFN